MTIVNKTTMILGLGTTGGAACALLSRGLHGETIIAVDGDALTPHNSGSVDTVVQHFFFPLVAPIMKAEAYATIYGVCPIMEYLDDDEIEALATKHRVEIIVDCRDHIGGEGRPLWKRIPNYYRFAADGDTFQVKRGRELGLVLGDQQGYQQQPNYLVVLGGAIALAQMMNTDGMLIPQAFTPQAVGYAPGVIALDSLFPLLTTPDNTLPHLPSALYHGMRVSGVRFTCAKCKQEYVPYGHIPSGDEGLCLPCALEGIQPTDSGDALTLRMVQEANIGTCGCSGDPPVGGIGVGGIVLCANCMITYSRRDFSFVPQGEEVIVGDENDPDDDDDYGECQCCGERMRLDDINFELACGDWVCEGCRDNSELIAECEECEDYANYASSPAWIMMDGRRLCPACATTRLAEEEVARNEP